MSQTGLETVYLKVETSFQSDGNNINVQKNNIGRPYMFYHLLATIRLQFLIRNET